ncbi:MAG: hypothetical protein HFJ55_04805 [Clostridia bacterium]|nr:hypothetical protein [Clostridia bacterium]
MSKNTVSIIVFALLLCLFFNAFSSSYASHNIMNLAYVLAIGIDVGEHATLKVSIQFTKDAVYASSSGSSPDDADSIVLVSSESDSIFGAINILNTYIAKEINLAHCSVIVFSEELAKKGISSEIYSLMNDEQIRPSTNIVISRCSAYDYLDNVKPNLEKLTTKYYDTFETTSKFTGYISNISIGDFYNRLCSKTCDSIAILGGLNYSARQDDSGDDSSKSSDSQSGSGSSSDDSSGGSNGGSSGGEESGSSNSSPKKENPENSSSEESTDVKTDPKDLIAGTSSIKGKRGTENIGLAVFSDDKLCGELSALEALCHLLISNKIDTCMVSMDNPISESKQMELQLIPTKRTKVCTDIKDNKPHVSLSLKLDADILTLEENIDYESTETIEKIASSAESFLEDELKKYLNKMSREYNADIDSFCSKFPSHFATIQELEEFNLKEKYKEIEFDINVDINMISSLLLTKT